MSKEDLDKLLEQDMLEIVRLLNMNDADGLREVLSDYKGEYAGKQLLGALLHPACKVTTPSALAMLDIGIANHKE